LVSNYKFLIIRFSSIGDVILTTPLIRSLHAKYPDCRIDFLVKKEFSAVLTLNPNLNEIIKFDKSAGKGELLRIRKLVKQNAYTHILDIQRNFRSVYIASGSGGKVSGFSKKILARDLLIRFKINIYRQIKPVYLRYFESAATLGVEYDGKGTEVFPPHAETLAVKELLQKNNFTGESQILVIAPGANWENKRWPAEKFAEAADIFCSKTGARAILIGGMGDVAICNVVQSLMKTTSLNLAGELSLMGSAALLANAAMVFTNDTGMLHMAQAMKAPVVTVFGPTTRELGFFPLPDKSRVAETEISCRPCTQKGLHHCPQKHFRCMNDIEPEVVSNFGLELYKPETGNRVL
jgi:heptosyltransferase-2